MGDETNKVAAKFGIAKDKPVSGEQDGKSNEQNVGGESGGFKQVDQTATTLTNNAESANNNNDTNEPGKGAAPSNEGDTGGVADNGPDATRARVEQSRDMQNLDKAKSQLYDPAGSQYRQPTAEQLGLKQDDGQTELHRAFSNQAAADAGVSNDDDGLVIYSSHPIQNFQVGPYHFEKTILKLDPEQAAEFDKLVKTLPLTESRNITKIDTSRVNDIVAARMGGATKQFDSSAGRAALAQLQQQFPKFGTEAVEDRPTGHANLSQTDNNVEIPLNPFDAKFNDDSNG